jgi:diguanylate cyclase (GGDEF)-like protein
MMPVLSGYEICKLIKENTITSSIPIIFLTGQTDENKEQIGLELGAVDYISKPVNPFILRSRVNTHVEIKRQRDTLILLSTTDGLTGVANRRHLDSTLKNEWSRSSRILQTDTTKDKNECVNFRFGIGMIDIDHFKKYNDTYGHQQGDKCLKLVAQTIKTCLLRLTDVIGRYGGEEFAIVLPQISHEGAYTCANRIQEAVANLKIPHEKSEYGIVTISIGIATVVPNSTRPYSDLVSIADQMLYNAKATGRNKVCLEYVVFDE